MNKIKLISILLLCLILLSCSSKESNIRLDSSLLNDLELVDRLKQDDPLFAFKLSKDGDTYQQTIYIWNNQLRRDLREDLIMLYDLLDETSEKVNDYSFRYDELDDQLTFYINNKLVGEIGNSSLTRHIIRAIFPEEFSYASYEFASRLGIIIIRLETLESYGDTEVICIITETNDELLFVEYELNIIHYIHILIRY
ncbi:MAG TPA: hypothetical protein PLJ98_00035 [Acholeplasmataceae bacterium]|nr:hypothetical protein [Acholeplasmataceae bacterium]HRX44792.1 hypothetical protein [Acholeplasmataceae bacterium]